MKNRGETAVNWKQLNTELRYSAQRRVSHNLACHNIAGQYWDGFPLPASDFRFGVSQSKSHITRWDGFLIITRWSWYPLVETSIVFNRGVPNWEWEACWRPIQRWQPHQQWGSSPQSIDPNSEFCTNPGRWTTKGAPILSINLASSEHKW